MLITALIILGVLGIIKPLRSGFYLLHIMLVAGLCWWIEQSTGSLGLFSKTSLSWIFFFHLISINIVTLWAYKYDKEAAIKNKRRIPEKTLHILALIGGTPAAYFGRKIFHHKTQKKDFIASSIVVVFLQIGILVALAVALN